VEINENKKKVNLLSFAYVYFLGSRLFNGLRPIQIKKSPTIQIVKTSGCPSVSRVQIRRPARDLTIAKHTGDF
jgi:hypothetical protein